MIAICKREFRQYFTSLQGYGYLAFILCLTGIGFYTQVLGNGYTDITAVVFSQFYYRILLFAVGIPLLTMRMFSQEKRNHTDRLLYSAPVSAVEIVCGKYLAALAVYTLGLLFILIYPIVLAFTGKLPVGMTVSGYLGLFLMGACMLAIGTFLSACIRDTLFTAIATILVSFLIIISEVLNGYIRGGVTGTFVFLILLVIACAALFYFNTRQVGIALGVFFVGILASVLAYFANREWFIYGTTNTIRFLSIESRFEAFMNGTVQLSAVCYLLTVTALFLYFSIAHVDAKRWR